MEVTPEDWNAVVAARWNPAILTPDGIAQRVFGLAEGVPVEVEIPLDLSGPPRVRHNGLLVAVDRGRLVVTPERPQFDELRRAGLAASAAVRSLPETPFLATGLNVKYRVRDPPGDFLDLLRAPVEDAISDAGQKIIGRTFRWQLAYGEGAVNLEASEQPASGWLVTLNFHCDTRNAGSAQSWLAVDADSVKSQTKIMIEDILHLRLPD